MAGRVGGIEASPRCATPTLYAGLGEPLGIDEAINESFALIAAAPRLQLTKKHARKCLRE